MRFRQYRTILPTLAAPLVVLWLVASPVTAQGSTCSLEPVSLPLFDTTPAAEIVASPLAPTANAPAPAEQQAVDALENILACVDSDSTALRYAIFTDRYLADLFIGEDPADQPAFERVIANDVVVEPSESELLGVSEFETLDDGRIAITANIRTTTESGTQTVNDRLVLAWDPDQEAWLIDAVLALEPPPATPTPPEGDAVQNLIDSVVALDPPPATPGT